MSRRIRLLASASALAVLISAGPSARPVTSAQAPGLDQPTRARVDEVFASFTKPGSPGCALAIYKDDRIAYSRGYGLASLEHGVPITPRTVFDIGSTAKQFTAFSILLLERDGKLSLDDDVRKFIPELPAYQRPITVRHLLNHTSGLRDYVTLWDLAGMQTESWTTQGQAVRLVTRQRRANFAAGDDFLYSNTGYLLLAEIVQHASGKSLKDFARERIFLPLGMTHTFYLDDHTQVVPGKATGYEPRESVGFSVDMSNYEQIGDGGLQTTVEDLLLWDRNFYAPKVADRALLERAQQVGRLNGGRVLDYAAGLEIQDYRGQRVVRHGGAWAGYRAELLRFPAQHTSIACLCNLGTSNPSQLADRVADVILAPVLKPAAAATAPATPAAAEVTVPENVLAAYAGIYRRADDVDYGRFDLKNGKLVTASGTVLTPLSATRFRPGRSSFEVVFSPQGGGAVECEIVPPPGSEARPVTYRKLPPLPAADLSQYAGDYYSDELDATWQVRVKDGGLVAGVRDAERPFWQGEAETFVAQNRVIIVFQRTGETVQGARVRAGRVRDLEFTRRAPAPPR